MARVHGRSIFGQIFEHHVNRPAFAPNPPRDDDVNRRPLLQNSVAFHASMATELCDRQSVDSTHHPSVTLKRSFMRQGLLLGEAREDDNDQSAGMPWFPVCSAIWPETVPNMGVITLPCEMSGDAGS